MSAKKIIQKGLIASLAVLVIAGAVASIAYSPTLHPRTFDHQTGEVTSFTEGQYLSNATGAWTVTSFDVVTLDNGTQFYFISGFTGTAFSGTLVPQLVGHTVNITYEPGYFGFKGYFAVSMEVIH